MYRKYGRRKFKRTAAKELPRGITLELYIDQKINGFNRDFPNQFMGIRLAIPVVKGERVAKQPADYMIMTQKGVWMFDAKETYEEKWYISKVPQHQIEGLRRADGLNCVSGFLIWFREDDLSIDLAVAAKSVRFVQDFRSQTVFTKEDGRPFDWGFFF